MNYIEEKIYGLPKPKRESFNTRNAHNYNPYIHKVNINGYKYFKVHIKRSDKSKIKYFKTKEQAETFVDFLRLNRYL